MRKASTANAKKTAVPKVGCFFVVNGRSWIEGTPWTENLSVAGFRTYAVGHPEYWRDLQEVGAVPRDLQYDEAPRGRVNYEDASGRFTLFADRCITSDKRLVSTIMGKLCLPRGTRVVADSHYRCPKGLGRKPTRKQEKEDWDL